MAFGEMYAELAKQRADDLVREGCLVRRFRRTEPKHAPATRVGCLPADRA